MKIVTMCGSSRFCDIMAVCAWLIEKQEHKLTFGLHLLPRWYCKVDSHIAEEEGVSVDMDKLHLEKIDMSSEVFIVNVDFYLGESTLKEITYATNKGKLIRWYTHDPIGYQVDKILKKEKEKNDSNNTSW